MFAFQGTVQYRSQRQVARDTELFAPRYWKDKRFIHLKNIRSLVQQHVFEVILLLSGLKRK